MDQITLFFSTWKANTALIVENYFAMTGGTLYAAERIEIGDHVTIGTNVMIVDSDFHPIDPVRKLANPNNEETAPVIIENYVFIERTALF